MLHRATIAQIMMSAITVTALMMWSGAAAADLSCKDFRRGYMLGDPDILQSMAQIATPLIIAENGGTMPEDRTGALTAMALRLQIYCEQLGDDSVSAIVTSMLKTAPERYRAAKEAAAKAAAEKAAEDTAARSSELSAAQRGAIADFVRRCWSTDPGRPYLDQMEVLLTVTTDSSGVARRAVVAKEDDGRVRTSPQLRMFSERAIRTVLDPNCANLPLPQAMLGETQTLTFRFRP